MFYVERIRSPVPKEALEHFPVYSGNDSRSTALGTLAVMNPSSVDGSLVPLRSVGQSRALSVYNHLEVHYFFFQLFFRTVAKNETFSTQVVQSTTPSVSFPCPSEGTFCALTILCIPAGDFPAGVVLVNGLSLEGNGTAKVVPGIDFDTPNFFFEVNERTSVMSAEVSVFGKAVSVVFLSGSTLNVTMMDGGLDLLTDEYELKNDRGFLTNPEYPEAGADAAFSTRLNFPPTTKIEIYFIDANYSSDAVLTLEGEKYVGPQTGTKKTFTSSPVKVHFSNGPQPGKGFLLRFSVLPKTSPSATPFAVVLCTLLLFVASMTSE
uniref:CUB domain-containing protein n=1 Tax=Steinernema glaseri TaxID=37863 RepID=A0A1I7ZWE0_9BILA